MLEILDTILNYLLANNFVCAVAALSTLILGFFGGYYFTSNKNKVKTLPNTSSFTHCDITNKHEYIAFTEPKLFFKPKITKCSCPHYHKGTCTKSNKTCILISQYSDNYFKSL